MLNNIPYKKTCNDIISMITDLKKINYEEMRQTIYDLLIYNYNIEESIYFIIYYLIDKNLITYDKYTDVMINTYYF